ncbi:MAG: BamA/TamA family outer membrane protein [Planctomycetes bacterium]|nr:BamA/TamA family outer membrane protein [Planctomycetota bacterium]
MRCSPTFFTVVILTIAAALIFAPGARSEENENPDENEEPAGNETDESEAQEDLSPLQRVLGVETVTNIIPLYDGFIKTPIESALFYSTIETQIGEKFSFEKTTRDIENLDRLGLFLPSTEEEKYSVDDEEGLTLVFAKLQEMARRGIAEDKWLKLESWRDIRFAAELRDRADEIENGVVLVYTLSIAPAVSDVIFEGNHVFDEVELENMTGRSLSRYLNRATFEHIAMAITREYVKKGYAFASVTNPWTRPDELLREIEPGLLEVTIRIYEGPRIEYENVTYSTDGLPRDPLDAADWMAGDVPEGVPEPDGGFEQRFEAHRIVREFFEQPSLSRKIFRWLYRKVTGTVPYKTDIDDFGAATNLGFRWYSREELDMYSVSEDMEVCKNILVRNGWLDAEVKVVDVEFSDDGETATVHVRAFPGQRYTIDSIVVNAIGTGYDIEVVRDILGLGEDETISDFISLKPGDFARLGVLEGDGGIVTGEIGAIHDAFLQAGYYYSKVELHHRLPETREDDETRFAPKTVIEIEIEQGEPTTVGNITIEGNTRTQEDIIRRWVSVYPGESFNFIEWQRNTQNRIRYSEYFRKEEIEFTPSPREDDRKVVDLRIGVVEGDTGKILAGGTFSSVDSFAANLSVEFRNFDIFDFPRTDSVPHFFSDLFSNNAFRGGGQILRFKLQPGLRTSLYSISFSDPYFLERDLTFDMSVYKRFDKTSPIADEESLGFSVGLGKYWTFGLLEDFFVNGTYSYQVIGVKNTPAFAPPVIKSLEGNTRESAFTFTYGLDKRDNPYSPIEGFHAEIVNRVAGGYLGSDLEYWMIEPKMSYYYPIVSFTPTRNIVGSILTTAGWMDAYNTKTTLVQVTDENGNVTTVKRVENDVPYFKKFYVGEYGSLRGFDYRGIGPRDDGYATGGKFKTTASAEINFPLATNLLHVVTFYDVASLSETSAKFEWGDYRSAYGFGFRFYIPVFGPYPLALDFARAIRKKDQDDLQHIHFNLGFLF